MGGSLGELFLCDWSVRYQRGSIIVMISKSGRPLGSGDTTERTFMLGQGILNFI